MKRDNEGYKSYYLDAVMTKTEKIILGRFEMKLRGKILSMVLGPAIVIGVTDWN